MPSRSFSVVARGLTVARGGRPILARVDLSLEPGARVGVVGPNGVGKTTLLRVLAGVDVPDEGTVTRRPVTTRVGYLAQEADRSTETLGAFLERRAGVTAAESALAAASVRLAAGSAGADEAYAAALDGYLASGGPDFDARMRAVCADLGLPARLVDAPTSTLSGGEAARASLASVLLSRFDVLLLDEPTNDLDFVGLERLEQFVQDGEGAVAVVSHDRAFLERTITSVVELDEHAHTAKEYAGGWAAYLEARATARRHAEEEYAAYRAERSRLEERSRTQRQWAVQGVRRAKRDDGERDKYIRHARIVRSEQQAAKARATDRVLERLEIVEKPWEGWALRLEIASAGRSREHVVRLDGAVVERGGFRLGPVDLDVRWGDRMVIVGPNGSGKTTLLLAVLGRVPLVAGSRHVGPSVVVGEIDQTRTAFSGPAHLLDAFIAETGLILPEARSLLAKFGLEADHVLRPTATLSPGERTRAVLARFQAQGVNCLVLDEPTNHLDLPAIEQLEQALESYEGTLLLVTHDRRLLDTVRVTRTVHVVGGSVRERT